MGKYKLVFLWTNSFNATDKFKADDVAGILPSNLAPIHEINILTDRTNILANDYVNPTEFHLFKSDATGGKTSGIGSTMYLASN